MRVVRRRSRPTPVALLLVGGLMLLAACEFGGETSDPPIEATTTEQGADPGEQPEGDPDATDAAGGPEGTRTIIGLPDELPDALLVDGAREVEGTLSRSGEDWTVLGSFVVDGELREVARSLDAPLSDVDIRLRQRSFDDARSVAIYDTPAGRVLTVTVTEEGTALRVSATMVGP